MSEEMRLHLELQTERYIAAGMDPHEAHYAARRQFGGVEQVKEVVREQRGWMWLDQFWRDVRFACRQLGKSPGFTLVAVATISVGIGAGTAVFSLVNAILLRSLPVPNPQELRVVHWSGADVRMRSYNGSTFAPAGNREVHDAVNHPTFLRLRERAGALADVFGYFPSPKVTMVSSSGAFSVDGLMVSDNFFSVLGVQPFIGQLFTPGDDAAGRPNVVITHRLWQSHFGGEPGVLGKAVTMMNTRCTIIGVLPAGFPGIQPGATNDFYTSMSAGSPFLYVPFSDDWHWFIRMMARMRPGHSDAEFEAALSPLFATADPERIKQGRIELVPGRGGLGFDRDLYGRPLAIMFVVTTLVMLVACANLAGLSLARGVAREHELAVRAALGAGRLRLIRQSLAESVALAVVGGGLGVLLAVWGRGALSRLLAGSTDGLHYDMSLDARVMTFGFAAALVTAVLAGLLPASRAGRVDPMDGLRARGAARAPRLRAGRLFVVIQICVSLLVLTVAGLGLRSLLNLRAINAGFSTDHLIVFSLNPMSAGYDNAGLVDFHRRARETLAVLPGVTSATVMDYAQLSGRNSSGGFRFRDDDLPPGEYRWTNRQAAGESFFATLGIPIVKGRGIEASDGVDAPKVVVVNETFARKLSPDRDPIGRTFNMWAADWRIVGVCRDAKLSDLKEPIAPTTYFSFQQRFYDRFSIDEASYAVRSPLPASSLRPSIERAIAAINPNVPVTAYTTQDALLDRNIGQERMLAMLCSSLAAVALLLCCIGLYGLIAYDVSRRTSEIAIRMAIGARPADVARPILKEALGLAAIGIGFGIPAVFGLERLIRSQLYAVRPNDPVVLVLVVLVLAVVALFAAWLPARRAVKIDPMVALRCE